METPNNHISYIELKGKDLEKIKAFYSNAFDWEFTDYGPDYVSFSNSGMYGGFEKTENDIVLLSGSSSVGTRDLGEQVIEKMGSPGIIIHGVAVKPGKPVIIARAGKTMLFGLPGHPVSAAISFDLFVRPAIIHLSGIIPNSLPQHRTITARLTRNISSAAGRTDFVRVQVKLLKGREPEAHPIFGKSGALSSMVKADGFIEISEKLQGLKEGEIVEVKLFD